MNSRNRILLILAAVICVALLIISLFAFASKPPVALIHVVNENGKPVAGAVISPRGLRTKPGPYASGWYGWSKVLSRVPGDPVRTDKDGLAKIPYPTYVFERIETGVIIPSIDHPDYVLERPELVVDTSPPAGSPWQVWASYFWNKIRRKALIAKTDTVALKRGAILKISVRSGSGSKMKSPLFAQISKHNTENSDFWILPESDVLMTRRLATGPQSVRAFQVSENGEIWFSDAVNIQALPGRTNELAIELKPGAPVRGKLDDTVPRPVKNGRVVAHVYPAGSRPKDSPPVWHAWTTNREDGTFEFSSLPPGNLEIVAFCEGFVSTSGPGTAGFRHPQKHLLGTNGLSITIGMEQTARLELFVTDDKGNPLKDAQVSTWPNVRYGDWSAVIFMSDLYNTSDRFLNPLNRPPLWSEPVPDLAATTDSSGLAVFSNLPADVKEFSVEHAQFDLPAITGWGGGKQRWSPVSMIPGQTNRLTVKLEPRARSPITHN